MLNPPLYRVLRKHFGEVQVYNEDVIRVESRTPSGQQRCEVAGESYNVNCPLCGDERGRLSISYKWLTKLPMSSQRVTGLANCYNESCPVHRPEFYEQFLDDLRAAELGLLDDAVALPKKRVRKAGKAARLPAGCVPIADLPDSHEAVQFIYHKYPGFPRTRAMIEYLSQAYNVLWTEELDPFFPWAQYRLVFPVYANGVLVTWQGRTVRGIGKRWQFPGGVVLPFYNGDRVSHLETPVVSEGIPASIACGPTGIALFNKTLNSMKAEEFASKWKSAVIATDPETFVPDNRKGGNGRIFAEEVRETLLKYIRDVRMVRWPEQILDLARAHNNGDDQVHVPDPADLGLKFMHKLIKEAA